MSILDKLYENGTDLEKLLIDDFKNRHTASKWCWIERINNIAQRIYDAYLKDKGLYDYDDHRCSCDDWGE